MNTSMNTSEYRRSWAQACWRSWRAEREMLAELAQGEAAALTRLPLEDWLEAGAAIDTLLQHIHAPEAGVEYPGNAGMRYRVTVLVDTLGVERAARSRPACRHPARKPHGRRVVPRCCRIRGMDATTLKGCPLRRV